MRFSIFLGFLVISMPVFSQEQQADSTRVLEEVVVKAYRSDRPLKDVPATINVINKQDLVRFGPMSLVTTVNTVPGVRMEERSPGSYRFSIRGSVLRSPFGIRNVKFYYRGLPFTDGGGNTYLNLLDMSSVGKMEIIKGPGSSLYGASTGGVVLLDQPPTMEEQVSLSAVGGSNGLFRLSGSTTSRLTKKSFLEIGISSQKSDGYRQQTAMQRGNARINFDAGVGKKGKLMITTLVGNLHYETPGGLNKTQYEADPRQARPSTQTVPGAVAQQASIDNTTVYGGTSYQHDWNTNWASSIGVYGSLTDFNNPAILNYEQREERNGGGRTETQYTFRYFFASKNKPQPDNEDDVLKGKLTFGAEYQRLISPVRVYENNGGDKGNLRTDDRLKSRSFFGFAQAEFELPAGFMFTSGWSLNFLQYDFNRLSTDPNIQHVRDFKPGLFMRAALIKKFGDNFSVYSSVSDGFSAPTLAEVLPSTSIFNNTLNAEKGRSVEVGVRSELFDRQIRLNVAAYNFRLRETIVVRSDNNGADFFANAGTTSQKGIESTVSWTPKWATGKLELFRLWLSYTYNDYQFLDYTSGGNDFSGKSLTGVPPTVVVGGFDLTLKRGWYLNASVNYTDHIPVNDGNTEFAKEYKIVSARFGKRQDIWKFRGIEIFAGVDNALDQKYSLGNDLNAAAGRYYNLAPGRSFYGGITLPLVSNQD